MVVEGLVLVWIDLDLVELVDGKRGSDDRDNEGSDGLQDRNDPLATNTPLECLDLLSGVLLELAHVDDFVHEVPFSHYMSCKFCEFEKRIGLVGFSSLSYASSL